MDCLYQHQPLFDGKQLLQDRLRYDGKWYVPTGWCVHMSICREELVTCIFYFFVFEKDAHDMLIHSVMERSTHRYQRGYRITAEYADGSKVT